MGSIGERTKPCLSLKRWALLEMAWNQDRANAGDVGRLNPTEHGVAQKSLARGTVRRKL